MTTPPPPTLDAIRDHIQRRKFANATDLALAAHPLVMAHELPWETGWAVCEKLGDRAKSKDPARAILLYELAQVGYRVMGYEATGSGEGLVAQYHIDRLAEIITRLQQKLTHD